MKHSFVLLYVYSFCIALSGCLKGSGDSLTDSGASSIGFAGANRAVNLNGTSIQIEWTLSTSPTTTSYKIYSMASDNTLTLVDSVGASVDKYVHSGLTAGNLYTYVVRHVDSVISEDQNLQSVSAIAYAGISSANVVSATSANLFFPSANGVTTLRIYCTNSSGNDYVLTDSVSAQSTSYTLTGLTTGVLYHCKVKALLLSGNEDFNSLIASFTPQTITPSLDFGFTGIASLTNLNGTSLKASWQSATPQTGTTIANYIVYLFHPDDTLTTYTVSAGSTNYTISNLAAGENYNVVVRAVDSNQATDSNQKMLTAFTYAGISSAIATSANSASVSFPAAPHATGLNIYCYVTGGLASTVPKLSVASTLTTQSLSGFSSATPYTCAVKAVGQAGEDNNITTATFTTP
jgi:titin